MKKGEVKVKLVGEPTNSKNKLYDVCIVWDGGSTIHCGLVMAKNEAEAKKLAKAAAKKATANL